MINDSTSVSSPTMLAEAESTTATKIKKTKKAKKIKKKHPRLQQTNKQLELEFTCYRQLCTRNVTENGDTDKSINAFITRTKIKSQAFTKEKYNKCIYKVAFPNKCNTYHISDHLHKVHEKLAKLSVIVENKVYEHIDRNNLDENLVKELIFDLISIKHEIITAWDESNPTTPYKYGNLQGNKYLILEDRMLDFVQVQLFNCYSILNDDENKQLLVDQLIEQKSIICSGVLIIMFFANISNHDNPEKLDFKDILIKFAELKKSYSTVNHGEKNIFQISYSNQLSVITSITRLLLDNTSIDYSKISIYDKLSDTFLSLVGSFVSYYMNSSYNTTTIEKKIEKLSSGIRFYFNKLDDPLFKEIHTILLTTDSLVFMEIFANLIEKLKKITNSHEHFIGSSQKNKKKLMFGVNLDTYNREHDIKKNDIKQEIKQLFTQYNIPTDNIDSWYDHFIEDSFLEIFFAPANLIVTLAEWVNLSKKEEAKQQVNIKTPNNLNNWLDTLVNEYKKIIDDQMPWNEMPYILLYLCYKQMQGHTIRLTFSTSATAKEKDIAIFYAKAVQIFSPFLGTALLAITHKDSYDALLTDLDMLKIISQQTDKTKYIKNSQYLIAQIITYLINQNDNLDLAKKQLLFTKAEKLYLELASSGINKAYLLLAETLATLAKAKTYEQNFLEAADLYYQASNYCKILSEVDNLETNLQDLALTNMNCFSSEADVLRKIHEEQTALLQEFTAPKITTKKKKKSLKQTTNVSTKIDNQDPDKEITVTEFVDWHQTYSTTASKSLSTKISKAKTTETVIQLPTMAEINKKHDFWITIRDLLTSSLNLTTSYTLLVKLTKNSYFKMLESQFKDKITQQDSWVVLFVYQNIAYYHFLQIKYAREIGNNVNNLQLFEVADSKTPKACKAEKFTFENLSNEAELFIRKAIKLVCVDIPDIETKDLREIFLSLSLANYSDLPQIYKSQLASLASTYGHLKSLEDVIHGYRGKARLAAKLYDKADEINPKRLLRKQEKQAS